MQATKQQQIIGYFIEEAKEHLDTIERGLLNLQATMADKESLNELFRAAHSVKGGAAMLGFTSVQQVAHYLEDCFKLLTENQVDIDRRLEDLFLKGSDVLKDLIDELQSPYGVQGSGGGQVMQRAEPLLQELNTYLKSKLGGGSASAGTAPANRADLVNAALRKMLQLFKQGDSPETRQHLQALCQRMAQMHSCQEWQALMQTTQAAIAHSKYPFQTMAAVIIKDLKQAGDLLMAQRTGEIAASKNLLQLAKTPTPVPAPTPAPAPAPPDPAMSAIALKGRQPVTLPTDPKAAAKVLVDVFDKQQLIQIADFIMKAIQ